MITLAVIIAVIIMIALLRFGVIVEYGNEGFLLWAKAGFLKFRLLDDDKPKKKKKKKPKKERNLKEMLPGSFSEFRDAIRAVLNALSRLKRRLLIKQLTLHYTSAGEDPANTALQFGAANATIGFLIPEIKKNFRVKRLDLRTWFDFTSAEQKIYAKIIISIAVWEVFYILFALMPLITAIFKKKPVLAEKKEKIDTKDRKDGESYGESPDQRVDGNNDAKNEGDD